MTPQQKEIIEQLPGNWIRGEDMYKLYPDIYWVADVYIMVLEPVIKSDENTPKKYIWVNRNGFMGTRLNDNPQLIDTIADAKIFIKNKQLENFR